MESFSPKMFVAVVSLIGIVLLIGSLLLGLIERGAAGWGLLDLAHAGAAILGAALASSDPVLPGWHCWWLRLANHWARCRC